MKPSGLLIVALFASAMCPEILRADPIRRAERLETLAIDAETGFSVDRYELKAGTYYRWRIATDGRDTYTILAQELFADSWIDKVTMEDVEMRVSGLHALTFEDESEVDLWFVPLRIGIYTYTAEGLEALGFSGEVIVK